MPPSPKNQVAKDILVHVFLSSPLPIDLHVKCSKEKRKKAVTLFFLEMRYHSHDSESQRKLHASKYQILVLAEACNKNYITFLSL